MFDIIRRLPGGGDMSDDKPSDTVIEERSGDWKTIAMMFALTTMLAFGTAVFMVVMYSDRSDRVQELAGMVSERNQQVSVLVAENDRLRESSVWSMPYVDAAAMAERASKGLETLIAGLDVSAPDKRTVLMGSFCGAWVDWRRLVVDDYSQDKPYPLMRYRDTAERLYDQLSERQKGMAFDEAVEKSCLVI